MDRSKTGICFQYIHRRHRSSRAHTAGAVELSLFSLSLPHPRSSHLVASHLRVVDQILSVFVLVLYGAFARFSLTASLTCGFPSRWPPTRLFESYMRLLQTFTLQCGTRTSLSQVESALLACH
eukprot:1610892-Pleurochrysis_carterae.AAC.1